MPRLASIVAVHKSGAGMSGDNKASVDSRIEAMKAQLDQLTTEHGRHTQFEAELIRLMKEYYKKIAGCPLCESESLAEEIQKAKPVLTAEHARSIWTHMMVLEDIRVDAARLATTYETYRSALEIMLEKCGPAPDLSTWHAKARLKAREQRGS